MKKMILIVAGVVIASTSIAYRDTETGTFLTRDPIGYDDGPNVYCYVHCNPITHFDPLGLLDLEHPEYMSTWKTITSEKHAYTFRKMSIKTDDGQSTIEANKNNCIDMRYNSNCHGQTFANGEYWIQPDQVPTILEGDGYTQVQKGESLSTSASDLHTGDVVLFYASDGTLIHSERVSQDGEDATLTGLMGLDTEPQERSVDDAMAEVKDANSDFSYVEVYRQEDTETAEENADEE